MLFHPSATITDHFQGAEDVLLWAGGVPDRSTARAMLETGDARLPDSLIASLIADPRKVGTVVGSLSSLGAGDRDRVQPVEPDAIPPRLGDDRGTACR